VRIWLQLPSAYLGIFITPERARYGACVYRAFIFLRHCRIAAVIAMAKASATSAGSGGSSNWRVCAIASCI